MGFASVVDFRAGGADRALFQIPVMIEGPEATRRLTADLEAAWGGDGDEMTVTGGDTLISVVTKELTDGQALSVGLTTLAAFVILVLYFGLGQRRPVLGLISIVPIVVVVIATFVVLPPLLVLWSLYHRWRTETELMTRLDALEAMEAQRGPD